MLRKNSASESVWVLGIGLALGLCAAFADDQPAPSSEPKGPSAMVRLALGAREIRPGDTVQEAVEKLGLADLGGFETAPHHISLCGSIAFWEIPAAEPITVFVHGHTIFDEDGDGQFERFELEAPLVWGVDISRGERESRIYFNLLEAASQNR